MQDDKYFLGIAVDEALRGNPSAAFGALVVKDGVIIAKAHNQTRELHDPSAHAEVQAMRIAGEKLQNHNLEGCVLYGSHEPCVMCFSCAAWANIHRVVYANPASGQSSDSYEFNDLSLIEISSKLSKRKIVPELIRIDKDTE